MARAGNVPKQTGRTLMEALFMCLRRLGELQGLCLYPRRSVDLTPAHIFPVVYTLSAEDFVISIRGSSESMTPSLTSRDSVLQHSEVWQSCRAPGTLCRGFTLPARHEGTSVRVLIHDIPSKDDNLHALGKVPELLTFPEAMTRRLATKGRWSLKRPCRRIILSSKST